MIADNDSILWKLCNTCKTEKPNDEFCKRAKGKYGTHSHCKPCGVKKSMAWNTANPEKVRAHQKAYQLRKKGRVD